MGTYYYLVNDTKKQTVHLDYHTKHGPITSNPAVQYAFINYLMCNEGDSCRLVDDNLTEIPNGYQEIDLLNYAFEDKSVMKNIVNMLNKVYEGEQYIIKNGVGVEIDTS